MNLGGRQAPRAVEVPAPAFTLREAGELFNLYAGAATEMIGERYRRADPE